MSSTPHQSDEQLDYPESDGKPIGETPVHRDNLTHLIHMLSQRYKDDPMTYVSGNMFLYYEPGNRTRALVPDVFVTKGIPKEVTPKRRVYLTWREGKGPDIVIELTSKSSQDEDMDDKHWLYRDTLKVPEYFVFDPLAEYLEPQLQGWSLRGGDYVPVATRDNRLVSEVLGLHLEAGDEYLRLYDPMAEKYLPSPPELSEILKEIEAELKEKEAELKDKERALKRERKAREQEEQALKHERKARAQQEQARRRAEDELIQLRKKLEELENRE